MRARDQMEVHEKRAAAEDDEDANSHHHYKLFVLYI